MQGDISFRKLFIKNGFRETSYGYLINLRLSCLSKKPWYQWKLKCVLQETSRHSNTAIKVVGDANETIGHIPEWLSKVVALASTEKKIMLSVEAEVTGHPRNAAEGKWTLGAVIKDPFIYRFYGPK